MAKKSDEPNPDPLAPARTRADWHVQGWASEAEPVTASSRLQASISVRFDSESAALLHQATQLKGRSRSQFVRQAALEAVRN